LPERDRRDTLFDVSPAFAFRLVFRAAAAAGADFFLAMVTCNR
jgi:hypothetical protein